MGVLDPDAVKPPTLPPDQVLAEFGLRYFDDIRSWQGTWLGRPVMQNPMDIWAIQQLLWRTRPEVIVETGTQYGGSCILWQWLLDACDGGEVITVDVSDELIVERDPRVHYVTGSSIAPDVVARVVEIVAGRPAMVILDSDHTPGHVAAELEAYSPLVGAGRYLVCQDTFIGGHPVELDEWEGGPWPAVQQFVTQHTEFSIDTEVEPMFTYCTDGYLRRS